MLIVVPITFQEITEVFISISYGMELEEVSYTAYLKCKFRWKVNDYKIRDQEQSDRFQ